jgi:NAD(P)-dependent dehydrogenase (short-subunit alcohol dehydrogenase family)
VEQWTPARIGDLSGRVAIVTGANSGIGFQTAHELAAHGARVVLAVRDPARGAEAALRIPGETEVLRLDLADLASVQAFAGAFGARHAGLDVLVNNAGIMAVPHARSADGFESQLATNHLGHFALTGLLLERLLARPDSRVVTVTSLMHRRGRIDFDDLQSERSYDKWRAYMQSKLANLLFALELQRRADGGGLSLRSVAAHPGYASTNLQARGPRLSGSRMNALVMRLGNVLLAQSDEMGAHPTLFAATEDVPGGAFVGPSGRRELRGPPAFTTPSSAAADPDTARRLWEVSEELTGVRYAFAPTAA